VGSAPEEIGRTHGDISGRKPGISQQKVRVNQQKLGNNQFTWGVNKQKKRIVPARTWYFFQQ